MSPRRRRRRRIVTALSAALLMACCVCPAAGAAARSHADFIQVQNDVMCVACHEPLAVAQSPEAFSERAYIRQLIAQGLTRTQIEKNLVANYGPAVLAKPPAEGFNLVIYILPPAVLAIGIAFLLYTLPKWRRSTRVTAGAPLPGAAGPLDPEDDRRLREDLARRA
ncbi:MAG TPA: cytochrome c-type biogenesis protein CcmH [Solirubrobacteraceae bacterium]